MTEIKNAAGEQQQPAGGGVRRAFNDGSESLSELREFMQGLRGKSPHEVLGDVANSSLVQSTLTAAVGFLLVIVGLSVATYYWDQAFGEPQTAAAKQPEQAAPAADTNATQPTKDSDPASVPAPGEPGQTTMSGDPLLNNLGSGETKSADPNTNPLESSLDGVLEFDGDAP